MINIFLFLAIAFFFVLLVGRVIEKIRVPWIFAALIFGFLLAIHNPFSDVNSSREFNFLAQLGMYFLLFIIGFELNLNRLKKTGQIYFKSNIFHNFARGIFRNTFSSFCFWI